jgi:hypothetical protein
LKSLGSAGAPNPHRRGLDRQLDGRSVSSEAEACRCLGGNGEPVRRRLRRHPLGIAPACRPTRRSTA